jgi:hypothetical protein
MKTAQELPNEFDRLSTHEELHQVLALLDEFVTGAATEPPSETEERKALRDAVMDLWQDTAADEHGSDQESSASGEMYPWAVRVMNKSDQVN